MMKIQRTLPPTAAPVHPMDLLFGLCGVPLGKWFIRRLEAELKSYFNVRYVFLVSSGKAALTLILLALQSLSPKRQVLIPAYTCFSVPSSIIKAGLEVSLCDIDPITFDFDYPCLKKAITEDTLCVVPSHLFGIPSDMDSITGLCKERGVLVLEDAAQAMGGTYKGRKLGTLGDVGFFSLSRGKNITCGSGGIIVTNSDRIAEKLDHYYSKLPSQSALSILKGFLQVIFMSIFIHPALYWFPAGLTFLELGKAVSSPDFPIYKFNGLKAGLLRRWKDRLEKSNRIRMETGNQFIEKLNLPYPRASSISYLRLPVLVGSIEARNRLYSLCLKRGLGVSRMYSSIISELPELSAAFHGKSFQSARLVVERFLTIPTHSLLSERDKRRLCELFNGVIEPLKNPALTAGDSPPAGRAGSTPVEKAPFIFAR
jgi:dTDP-4-amino-4,6-dideoxygalactose transaminase